MGILNKKSFIKYKVYNLNTFLNALTSFTNKYHLIVKVASIQKLKKNKITLLRAPKVNKNSREVFIKTFIIIKLEIYHTSDFFLQPNNSFFLQLKEIVK